MVSHAAPPRLTGRVVAITGGARGIGRATAAAFVADGATVAIGDTDIELADKTAAALAADTGGRIVALPLDVTDRASFATFLDSVDDQLGGLDVLVNNAGIMPTGAFADEDDAMTDRQLDVNVRGVQTGCRLAVHRFRRRGGGHIVNIASLAGVTGYPGLATYCGTKHFVVGFTDALWGELRDEPISISAVLPAIVRTELSAGAKVPRWLERMNVVDPSEVADGVVAAVLTGKPKVVVPGRSGALLKAMSLLSTAARFRIARLSKLDVTFTEADPQARADYHRRISQH